MKISNNALNFLLAQYRAIFKRAYVKGIASAVILTAGLAAGAAQAVPNDAVLDKDDFLSSTSGIHTADITSNSKLDMKDVLFESATGNAYINTVTVDGANVEITGAAGRHFATTGGLTIKNGGKFTVTNTDRTDTHIYGGGNGAGAPLTITGEGSTLTASSAAVNFGAITVEKGATVNLDGLVELNHDLNQEEKNPNGKWWFYTNLSAVGAVGAVTVSDSTVNLRDQSHVGADVSVNISGDSTITFDGAWHDLKTYDDNGTKKDIEGTGYATAFIRGNNLDGKSGTVTISASRDNAQKIVDTPELNVLAGRNGAIYANKIDIKEAKVNIGSGGKFILDGDWVSKELKDEGTHSAATVTLKDVTFTNSGTLVLGSDSQSGGRIDVTGNTDMQGDLDNYDNIYVGANSVGAAGHLIISEDQIVQQRDESGDLIHDGVWTGKNVGVLLNALEASEATLEVKGTDADGLDLNKDVQFVSNADISASDKPSEAAYGYHANKINVYGPARIKGEHLVLHSALAGGDLNDAAKLTLEANTLELGANDYSGATLTGLDIVGGAAHDDISLNGSGDIFTVDGDIELSRDFYQKDASGDYTTASNGFGTIRGDNLKVTSGSITINGAAWQNEDQGLTITSGTLTVGAVGPVKADGTAASVSEALKDGEDSVSGWKYIKNGNPASLTWHGAFNISGGDTDEANVKVTGALGADSTLDLRAAKVSWGSGTVTLSGSMNDNDDPYHVSATDFGATAGQGILRITGSQLSDFLNIDNGDETDTNTVLNLAPGGVLLVDGTVTGTINFNKFVADNADDQASGAGTINFDTTQSVSDAGWLIANGELTLVTGELNGDGDAVTDSLNIGDGTLFAEGLTINNLDPALDAADADPAEDVVKVTDGTIGVAQRLSSTNNEILFEDSTLLLDSKAGDNNDYGLSSSNGGVVNVNQLRFTSGAGFEVATGDWTVSGVNNGLGDLYFDDSSFEVGTGDADYQRYGYTASLTADNLSFNDGEGDGTDILVASNGKLTVNTIQAPENEIVVAGTMTLNGRTDFTAENLTSEPESLQDLGVSGANAQAGIDLTGAILNLYR